MYYNVCALSQKADHSKHKQLRIHNNTQHNKRLSTYLLTHSLITRYNDYF